MAGYTPKEDELSALIQKAQELGQAFEASADKLSAFALSARNSLISMSGATEDERKKISQLYSELERRKDIFKEMKDDYQSAYIIATNYYNRAKMAGKDVSGLEKMSDELRVQYDQLKKNLDLLNAVEGFVPKRSTTSAQTGDGVTQGGVDYVPSAEAIRKDMDALEEFTSKLASAGFEAKGLGEKVVAAMTESKLSTAEGRQEIAGLVTEFNLANQKYLALANKFKTAQLQLVEGIEAFENKNGTESTNSFLEQLEMTTDWAYRLDKELRSIQTTISSTTKTSPDLVESEDKSDIIQKNIKAKKELNTVFSEENRILQENRALLAQDQEYVKQKAIADTSAEGSIRQMVAQMKLYKMELENLNPTLTGNKEAMDILKDKINELDTAIKMSSAEQKKHVIDISQYGQSTAYVASDIRRAIQALTQLRVSMGQVDVSTDEGKAKLQEMVSEYQRLNQEIGSLKREYNTIKATTQALGSQAGIVANVGSMMNAAVYSTQALTGAINLVGGSTSEWGQTLVKLQSIMAITNGLTMTYNSLLKTGRIYTLAENATLKITTRLMGIKNSAKATEVTAENAATSAKIAGTVAQEAENVATEAGVVASEAGAAAATEHAAAETARAGAITASTAAARGFNKAMKAGPLIIISAIIAAIVGIVKAATKAMNEWRLSVLRVNAALNQTKNKLETEEERLNALVRVQKQVISYYKELAQAMHLYYTNIQDFTGREWDTSAEEWFNQLQVALKQNIMFIGWNRDEVDGLKKDIEKLGPDMLKWSKWNDEDNTLEYFGTLKTVMGNLNEELKAYTGLVSGFKEKLDAVNHLGAGQMDAKMDVELAYHLTGYYKRMTYQEAADIVTAKLNAALAKKEAILNLNINGNSLIARFREIQANNQREALEVANMVLQAQNDAQIAAVSNIEQRFNRERALARANTKAEIDQLKYRLKTEENLGVEGQAAINKKISALQTKLAHDIREINEEELQATIDAIRASEDLETEAAVDSHALRMSLLKQEHDRAIEDINTRLAHEQDLTTIEIQELKYQRALWDDVYAKRKIELERELQQELIDAEKSRYEMQAEIAKENSERQLNYTKEALKKELENELIIRQQLTEEERALYATEAEIRIKYAKAIAQAELDYSYNTAKEIHDARMRWDKAVFNQRKHGIWETAKFEMEQQVAALELERKKYAEQLVAEAKLIALQVELGEVTEEEAKRMFAELDPIVLTIEAIDREIQNLKDNWDKDLEYNNLWEMMGFDKKQAEGIEIFLDSLKDSLQEALDAWADYYAEKAQMAEENLEDAKSEYEIQQQLRAEGYANSVETARAEMLEKARLRRLAVKQQKEAERQQEELNTALAISEMAVAVAKVFKDFGWPLGAVMAGTMIAAFVGAKISAARAASASAELYREGTVELLEGGSHASGKDISLGKTKDGRERRAEGGEFLAIINKRNSRKYRSVIPEVINSLNNGTFDSKFETSKTLGLKEKQTTTDKFAYFKNNQLDLARYFSSRVTDRDSRVANTQSKQIDRSLFVSQSSVDKDPTLVSRYTTTSSKMRSSMDSIVTTPVLTESADLSVLEREVKSIRKQGEKQVYIDEQGNKVEVKNGITRKTYKR